MSIYNSGLENNGIKILRTILAFLLSVVLIVSVGACANSVNTEDVFDFSKDGYSIIRPADAVWGTELSGKLLSALNGRFGVSPVCVEDTQTTDGAEIIIGNADRDSVKTALQLLCDNGGKTDNDYIICANNGNVVIAGVTDRATEAAVEYFVESKMYCSPMDETTTYVNVDKAASNTVTISGQNIGYVLNLFRIITPLYNRSYIVEIQVNNFMLTTDTELQDSIIMCAMTVSRMQEAFRLTSIPSAMSGTRKR